MRVYDKKIGDLNRLEAEFKGRDRSDNLVKQEIWDRQSGEKFKIYRSSADGKPRIEIDTTNVNIKPSAFNFRVVYSRNLMELSNPWRVCFRLKLLAQVKKKR